MNAAPELEAPGAYAGFFVSSHDSGSFQKSPVHLRSLFPGSLGPPALLLPFLHVSFGKRAFRSPHFPISCLVVAMETIALCSTASLGLGS